MNSNQNPQPEPHLSLGHNAMVAGDVHQRVEIHQQVTAQMVSGTCGSCGRELRVGFSWKCSSCGQTVCADHYQKKTRACESCHQRSRENARKDYGNAFISLRSAGPLDPASRKALSEKALALGLEAAETREIESSFEEPTDLREYRTQQMELARHLLGQGRGREAMERLQAMEREADHDSEFWILYAETLATTHPAQAMAWMQGRSVELPERYFLEFCIQGNPALAGKSLHEGRKKFPQDSRLQACRILELYEIFLLTQKEADFQKAFQEWQSLPGNTQDPYLASVYCLMAQQPVPEYVHPFFQRLRNIRAGRKTAAIPENPRPQAGAAFGADSPSSPHHPIHDQKKEKFLAMLGYLPPLFFIPLLAAPQSKFCRFHANQALMVFLCLAALQVATPLVLNVFLLLPFTAGILLNLLSLLLKYAPIALVGIGMYHAFSEKCVRLPWIGDFDLIKSA